MGKFDGLLLVSDFDDTLYDDQRRIPERNLRALQYFLEEGGRFTVAGPVYRLHRAGPPHLRPLCPSGPHQRAGDFVQWLRPV